MKNSSNIDEFEKLVSNLTNFSHAYLFEVDSLSNSLIYVKDFAKKIILNNIEDDALKELVSFQIDTDNFDDLYIINPETISIKVEEIKKLLQYFKTKSLRSNGKRVYIIYGFERLDISVSNKILKFLEEPEENIYAILMSENTNSISSTIKSRCQTIYLKTGMDEYMTEDIEKMKKFLNFLFKNNTKTIAYINNYWDLKEKNRKIFNDDFKIIQSLLISEINNRYSNKIEEFSNLTIDELIKVLDITNSHKKLINNNINLNLMLDRYIIEITRGVLCK